MGRTEISSVSRRKKGGVGKGRLNGGFGVVSHMRPVTVPDEQLVVSHRGRIGGVCREKDSRESNHILAFPDVILLIPRSGANQEHNH